MLLEMHVGVDWKYCRSCLCIYVADPKLKDVADHPQGLLRGSPGFLRSCCAAFLRHIVCWRYCIGKFPCGCIKRMRGCLSFGVNSKCRRMPGLITCENACSHQASVLGMYPLAPVLTWRFDCDLLEKQNGINEIFLFHNADLRIMLFSAWSAFQPIFYCPKPVHFECL